MDIRVGNGFDVHRFEEGDHVVLCGVPVPHDKRLAGHSDADVSMHALTDAIYGALSAGDIGQHFPPSDPQWKGANSRIFLQHAVALAAERGFRVTQADVTLICERPKVGPHAPAMREALAGIMGLDPARISVKATTSERLGFTGREEGIAAMATATLVAEGGLPPLHRRRVLSFFGVGYLRPAPGTWGSLAALPFAWILNALGGPLFLAICAIVLFWIGYRLTRAEIEGSEDHDPSWIVLDEVVGQWIAVLPVAIGAAHVGLDPLRLWPGVVAAFLLFRLFDVWKPWHAGRADGRGDAFGLMADDVWAGIFAAVIGILLAGVSHGVMAL